jgi:hypothetical protein
MSFKFFQSGRKAEPHEINTVNHLRSLAKGEAELSSNAKNTIRRHARDAINFYLLTCDPIRKAARAVWTPNNNGPQYANDNLHRMNEYPTAIAVVEEILKDFHPKKPIIMNSRIDHVLRQFNNYDWSLECAEPATPSKSPKR